MARIRRMTSAQMEGVTAYRDDILIATDTGNIFVSGSNAATKVMIGKAAFGATEDKPDAGVEGRFYYDTDLGALFVDNGTEWVNASLEGSSFVHAASHIGGEVDEVDGDKLDVDWNPSNYSPALASGYSTSVDHLTSHLKGIDAAFLGKADDPHTHEFDDIDFDGATLSDLGVAVPVDGSGCTVDITADAGVITDIVLNAGGLNYQASDVVTIAGGNADATATVATVNAETGAVTAIGLTVAGTGYTTGTGVATTTTTTRAWSTTAMSGLTNASTLQAALQAIHDDIAAAV